MTDESRAKAEARRQRLEEQLRDNLKRRKEQARARRQRPEPAEETGTEAPPEATGD